MSLNPAKSRPVSVAGGGGFRGTEVNEGGELLGTSCRIEPWVIVGSVCLLQLREKGLDVLEAADRLQVVGFKVQRLDVNVVLLRVGGGKKDGHHHPRDIIQTGAGQIQLRPLESFRANFDSELRCENIVLGACQDELLPPKQLSLPLLD
jgi:hypothetical protein